MTLIVGIKCEDGIVVAADGAATYAVMGQSTIRQAVKKKLSIIDSQVIVGCSGPVGLGQRFCGEIEGMWKQKAFSPPKGADQMPPWAAMTMIRQKLWEHIKYETEVARYFAQSIGPFAIQRALITSLVALPVSHKLCLFQFDEQGAPEEATDDLPFVAIGSGQPIADPFLAFLRRVLWGDKPPKLSLGILSAVWTINHAIQTNPGGVSEPIQVITIALDGTRAKTHELSEEEIAGENIELIDKAERKLAESFTITATQAVKPASPPTAKES